MARWVKGTCYESLVWKLEFSHKISHENILKKKKKKKKQFHKAVLTPTHECLHIHTIHTTRFYVMDFCVYVFCAPCACLVTKPRRGQQILWNWSCLVGTGNGSYVLWINQCS